MKSWKNVELDKVSAIRFKRYLTVNGMRFESSEADNLIHFEVFVDDVETAKANRFLEFSD